MANFVYRLPLGTLLLAMISFPYVWLRYEEIISRKHKRFWLILNFVLFLVFSVIIFWFTLNNRSEPVRELHLQPFYSFILAKSNGEMYRTMLMNVALFFPFGLTLASILPEKTKLPFNAATVVLCALFISTAIEAVQYCFSLGKSEIDDVLCNVFGAMLGGAVLVWEKVFQRIRKMDFYEIAIENYLAVTFFTAWVSWGLLSVVKSPEYHFSLERYISEPLHIIGGFAPVFGALAVVGKKDGLKRIFGRFFHHKKESWKYLTVFIVFEIAVFSISSMTFNVQIPFYFIPLIFLQAVFIYGGNEEIGWRGILQPKLEKKFSFPVATLITGIIWSAWHIPLWFVDGASQQNISFLHFLILSVILSFWLAALYKCTKSIFFCAVLHGLTNTLLSIFVIKINLQLILGLFIITVYSIVIYKRKNREL